MIFEFEVHGKVHGEREELCRNQIYYTLMGVLCEDLTVIVHE